MALDYPKISGKLPGKKAALIIKRNQAVISRSYTFAYPFVASHGQGAKIMDVDGNSFLDFTAGIAVCATGHAHPRVVSAIRKQSEKLLHMSGTDFYYEAQVTLAEKLAALAPGKEPKRVFFCNSGAEAVEAAIKLARWHTRRKQVIAFFGSFHGRTLGALSLSASKAVQREHFFPLIPGVTHIPYPDPYRGVLNGNPAKAADDSLAFLEELIFKKTVPPHEVAAIVVEPIQGEGGYVVPPRNFHKRLHAICKKHDILYIADEIQSGMGRTGKMFASEHFGVVPDIMCLAKGIASGMPLGAIVSSDKVMNWTPGSHASTFGGNPVACEAAVATIELLEESLMKNAAEQGRFMLSQLLKMKKRHKLIGDVRGLGLMIGMELVKNSRTKERAIQERDAVVQRAFERGLLILGCGPNTIRFCPPLVISREEARVALDIFEEALVATEKNNQKRRG